MQIRSNWKNWKRTDQRRKWMRFTKNFTEMFIPVVLMTVFCYGFSVLWLLVW